MLIQKYFNKCKQAKERYKIKYLYHWKNNFICIKPLPNLQVTNKIAKFAPLRVKQVKRLAFTPPATGCSQLRAFSILPHI